MTLKTTATLGVAVISYANDALAGEASTEVGEDWQSGKRYFDTETD